MSSVIAPASVIKLNVCAGENWTAVRWLLASTRGPKAAVAIWCFLWTRRDPSTGEIVASREEIASAARTTPRNVSRVMTLLESVGAVTRQRRLVRGLRGPGEIVYTLHTGVTYPEPH